MARKQRFKEDDVFIVLGRRGCGKSHLARGIQKCYPRKVIFDTLGEYDDPAHLRCDSFGTFERALIEAHDRPEFTIVFQFDLDREDQEAELNAVLRSLYRRGEEFKTSTLIVLEEVQTFATTHRMPHWLKHCLLRGRHRDLALLFTTQRPGECHKTIISQANYVFCGSLHERNDVDYARSVLGDQAHELATYPDREFLLFRPGRGTERIDNEFNPLGKK